MIGRAIIDVLDAVLPRAVRAAEVLAARLEAVADDRHLAVHAARCEDVNRTLERIEDVSGASDLELERLVVGIAAALAVLHCQRPVQAARLRVTGSLECALLHNGTMSRSSSRIRIAVVGLGHFAQAAVLPAIEQL